MTVTDAVVALATTGTSDPSPSSSPTVESPVEIARQACETGSTLCTVVTSATGSPAAGQWTEVLVGTPLQILLVLAIGWLVRQLVHRAIDRVVRRVVDGDTTHGRSRRRGRTAAVLGSAALTSERRVQRARTMGSVLRSISTGVVAVVVVLMVLAAIGLNVGPLLAGAGILGVALGFGSQTLVKDFLSGVFLIVEDQYGVGDVVDLGDASGTVEAVGLRVTRLRSVEGTVWYVRNGEILRVGNKSQGWARAVLDVGVAYGEDLARVQQLLRDVGAQLQDDPEWSALVMDPPEVWGVEALAADSVVVRLVVKTEPLQQWVVARELRRRIKVAFDAAGVEIPFSQRTVWLRQDAAQDATQDTAQDAAQDTGQDAAQDTGQPTARAAGAGASSAPPPPSESEASGDITPDDTTGEVTGRPGRPDR